MKVLTIYSAYPLASVGHAAWILRHYGYRAVFIWGLCLYALGALLAIAALKQASFGGFCACIFIIGNGLGSLETAANPFITGRYFSSFLVQYGELTSMVVFSLWPAEIRRDSHQYRPSIQRNWHRRRASPWLICFLQL